MQSLTNVLLNSGKAQGKFKDFDEEYTHQEHSTASRKAYQALLNSFVGQVVEDVAAARGLKRKQVAHFGPLLCKPLCRSLCNFELISNFDAVPQPLFTP